MSEESFKSFVISFLLCTFAHVNEPLKQAGGSASSALTINISRKNTEIRRFSIRNLENCVLSQTYDKQRKFEISSKVTKKRVQNKTNLFVFYAGCIVTSRFYRKVTKSRVKRKRETCYLNQYTL